LGSKQKIQVSFVNDIWTDDEKVSPTENELLIAPFSQDEIHKAVFQMNPNKASGLDDFFILFYQTYWDLIKDNLVLMFQDFHQNKFDISRLNRALICLIPKVKDANSIK
jgi:hypothetical protein